MSTITFWELIFATIVVVFISQTDQYLTIGSHDSMIITVCENSGSTVAVICQHSRENDAYPKWIKWNVKGETLIIDSNRSVDYKHLNGGYDFYLLVTTDITPISNGDMFACYNPNKEPFHGLNETAVTFNVIPKEQCVEKTTTTKSSETTTNDTPTSILSSTMTHTTEEDPTTTKEHLSSFKMTGDPSYLLKPTTTEAGTSCNSEFRIEKVYEFALLLILGTTTLTLLVVIFGVCCFIKRRCRRKHSYYLPKDNDISLDLQQNTLNGPTEFMATNT